jgi:hypothetical protein
MDLPNDQKYTEMRAAPSLGLIAVDDFLRHYYIDGMAIVLYDGTMIQPHCYECIKKFLLRDALRSVICHEDALKDAYFCAILLLFVPKMMILCFYFGYIQEGRFLLEEIRLFD